MNKEQYIKSRFRSILSETLQEKVRKIEKDLDQEAPFHGAPGPFDYVQEGKETCNECGGMMKEGECKECGWKGDKEVMESGLKKLEKISSKEIEDLLGDIDSDLKKSTNKRNKHKDTEEVELELDEEECKECGPSSYEMKEKLYGKQNKLDKNKNGKIDKEDFKMLRKQQDEETLYEVEFEKEVEEGETDESREFAYAAMMAKKKGKDTFELDGETFDVKESYLNEKWGGDVDVKQTGEYSDMSIEELNAAIKKQKAKNDKTKESGKKVSHADKTKMSRLPVMFDTWSIPNWSV